MTRKRNRKARRWGMESLEQRQMMAADISLNNGVLTIEAEDGRETHTLVEVAGDTMNVHVLQFVATDAPGFGPQLGEQERTYGLAEVNKILYLGSADQNSLSVSQAGYEGPESTAHLEIEFHGGERSDFFHNSSWIRSTAHGGGDDDFLRGGFRNDRLFGDDGHDTINGFSGDDYLDGGLGFDLLQGESGNDTLYGRAGGDILDGGGGNDRLYGGSGHDLLFGAANFVKQEGQLLWGSQAQFDFGQAVEGMLFGDQPMSSAQATDAALHSLLGDDYASELESGEMSGSQDGDDRLYGESGNDIIYGGAGNDRVVGGGGNDLLLGGSGHDYLYGDGGEDVIRGGTGSDYLDGGAGDDFLYGGAGSDRLFGRGGADFLSGGADNDYLVGGYDGAQDVLQGGASADKIVTKYAITNKPTPYSIPTTTIISEELVADLDLDEDTEITLEYFDAPAVRK